ncbi:MAG TPA: sigma-70 family RNA polymerase sigma factor [Puia sp.]|jgi:RNA polymerase sigma factor (sigma-70 family)|nr:sigma-70 family RNA polymerase sigma factor [Puia sp.]
MEDILTINPRMPSSPGKNIASVISRFGKRLLGFIRQRVGNEADAEDILQDVWYQLTTTVDTEPIEQISGWLFAVARNKIIDRYRKKQPEPLDLQDGDDAAGPDLTGILLDDSQSPETANLRTLFWRTLQEALDELPEQQRMVFVWNELEGISFKEIAAMTGENVNTLISRKRYAVLHLRERLLTLYQEIIEH